MQADWDIRIKRAYKPRSKDDGCRILVDRVWPRGVTKEALKADYWLRHVAPSTTLRKWFNHQAENWPEFQRRYRDELIAGHEAMAEELQLLKNQLKKGRVTLVYGAKDEEHNQAVVLRGYLTAD